MDFKRLILLRHGESTANKNRTLTGQTDADLTRTGVRQAKRASRFIRRRFSPVDAVYTSPLSRAAETARIISRRARAPLFTDELLTEVNFGLWEGLSREELMTQPGWEDYAKNPFHFIFPGGESPQEARRRALAFKEKLLSRQDWKSVVVVAHYTPLVFLLMEAFGNGNASSAPFKLDNAALSIIEISGETEVVQMLNFQP